MEGAGPWLVYCHPEEGSSWSVIQQKLNEIATQPSLEQKYGLSKDTSALLKWILSLHPSDYLGNLTPTVEDNAKLKIGFETKWPEENMPALVQMLLDEINEKTEFRLKIQMWKDYSTHKTRISVNRSIPEIDRVVRQIQLLGLSESRLLKTEVIKETLHSLLDYSS